MFPNAWVSTHCTQLCQGHELSILQTVFHCCCCQCLYSCCRYITPKVSHQQCPCQRRWFPLRNWSLAQHVAQAQKALNILLIGPTLIPRRTRHDVWATTQLDQWISSYPHSMKGSGKPLTCHWLPSVVACCVYSAKKQANNMPSVLLCHIQAPCCPHVRQLQVCQLC